VSDWHQTKQPLHQECVWQAGEGVLVGDGGGVNSTHILRDHFRIKYTRYNIIHNFQTYNSNVASIYTLFFTPHQKLTSYSTRIRNYFVKIVTPINSSKLLCDVIFRAIYINNGHYYNLLYGLNYHTSLL
jgi:hypothetical protein